MPAHGNTFGIVTSDPPPYRVHLFRALAQELAKHRVGLFVHILADRTRHRFWQSNRLTIGFPFRIEHSWVPCVSVICHCNPLPGMSEEVRSYPWLLVGGYFAPTLLALGLAPKPPNQIRMLWCEAASHSPQDENQFLRSFKRLLISRFDAVVVPGRRSSDYVTNLMRLGRMPAICHLPNVIDDKALDKQVRLARTNRTLIRKSLSIDPSTRMVLCVSRLVKIKGLHLIIDSLNGRLMKSAVIIVAGDGPERRTLERMVLRRGLGNHIRFLGHCAGTELVQLYAAADAFLHASFLDRFPLAVVEALFAGLPLIVSDRVGSYPEVLEEGRNGIGFDVLNPKGVRGAIERILTAEEQELGAMSEASYDLARGRFATDKAVTDFVRSILSLRPHGEVACPSVPPEIPSSTVYGHASECEESSG